MPILSVAQMLEGGIQKVPSFVGDGVLPISGKMLIGGDRGIGKSILVSNMAYDLAAGEPLWGHVSLPVLRPLRVMYVENEVGEYGVATRFNMLARFKKSGNAHKNITVVTREPLQLAQRITEANKDESDDKTSWNVWGPLFEAIRPEVVIGDPLATLHNCDENSNSDLTRIVGQIDYLIGMAKKKLDLDMSWVVVHHFKKRTSEDAFDTSLFRGASRLADWADTRVLLNTKKGVAGPDGVSHNMRQISFAIVRQGPAVPDLQVWIDPQTLIPVPAFFSTNAGTPFG